ncbi:hypothetical protein ISCGN_011391 [Ixodes scapularis]
MAPFATRTRYLPPQQALFRLVPYPDLDVTIPDTDWQTSCPTSWSSGKLLLVNCRYTPEKSNPKSLHPPAFDHANALAEDVGKLSFRENDHLNWPLQAITHD